MWSHLPGGQAEDMTREGVKQVGTGGEGAGMQCNQCIVIYRQILNFRKLKQEHYKTKDVPRICFKVLTQRFLNNLHKLLTIDNLR